MNTTQNKIYFPIIFLLSWLTTTILVFIFGPYKYNITNSLIFYAYLLVIHIALYFGYVWGQNSNGRGSRLKVDYERFVKTSIIVSLIYYIVKLIFTFGGDLRHFGETFINANETYMNSSLRYPGLFSYLDIFFAPIIIIAITNTLFSYKNLNRWYRYVVYIIILLFIASSIGSATRSGIVKISIISLAALSLGIYKKNFILQYRHKVLMIFLVGAFILGFLTYSSLLTNTRGGLITINPLSQELPRENYFLHKITPQKLHPLINNVSFYISHSYYRLNMAMNLPFKGLGFGLSNSYFVMDNIEELTGSTKLKEISYGMRLDNELGGNYGAYWSTFYTWIASDFTFPGTILVIFLIGFIFSLAMKDSLFESNPLSVAAFCTLFYFIFHFAFNNPLQDGQGITTFLFIPLIWLVLRK